MARVLTVLSLLALGAGAAPNRKEYTVKAAFLYHFGKFVTWPDKAFKDAAAPLVLGVLGEDPFGKLLDKLGGKEVRKRKLAVRRVKTLEEVRKCHILFVASSERTRFPKILEGVQGAHVLTVGDRTEFAESGGVMSFFLEKGKVRFAFNEKAEKRAGLKLSAQLKRLGRKVKET